MVEVILQEVVKEVESGMNMVDFAIACVRGLRNLKESQDRGELDTITYLNIMQDIENIVHEVTKKLLFIL